MVGSIGYSAAGAPHAPALSVSVSLRFAYLACCRYLAGLPCYRGRLTARRLAHRQIKRETATFSATSNAKPPDQLRPDIGRGTGACGSPGARLMIICLDRTRQNVGRCP